MPSDNPLLGFRRQSQSRPTLDAPLLFKGEDFSHTDVARCV